MDPVKVKIIDDGLMDSWDNFVEGHPYGTIYHTSTWGDIIKNSYGHRPMYFALLDNKDSIIAGLPIFLIKSIISGKRFSTIPCGQSCTPLVENVLHYNVLKTSILDAMNNNAIGSWELKTVNEFNYEKEDTNTVSDEYSTYVLTLTKDPLLVYKNFHKSCIQRAIKKAKRNNIDIKQCKSRKDLKDFYTLYLAMRKKEGLLPQPMKFFENVWDNMITDKRVEVLYALHDHRVISAILLLRYKNKVTYEYGATDYSMRNTGASPLLLWESIRHAIFDGYQYYDFGRTNNSDEGLKLFKQRWGAIAEPLRYYTVSNKTSITELRQSDRAKNIMARAVKLMPTKACELAGNMVYKHLV